MNPLTDPQLDAARQALQKSLDIYGKNQATLYTFDGKKINAPSIHEREAARLLEPVQDAVDRAVALADRVTAEVEAARLAPFSDPTSQLSAADLADANARAQFIKEDCATLPLDDLVERLRAVHASGNKASTWLHDRYAKRRWQKESAKSTQDPALSMFAQTLRDIGVTGAKAGLSDEQQKRLDKAQSLRMFAGSQLRIARDPEQDARDKAAFRQAIRL